MGLFSSKKKIVVDTAITRMVEDRLIPDSTLKGLIRGIIESKPLAQSMQLSTLNGPFHKFERMYRYAKRGDYFYGAPDARVLTSTDGVDLAKAAIESEEGGPVTVAYLYFRPLNHVHQGRKHITENLGYDHEDNELTVLSVQKGFPVFLKDLVATYNTEDGRQPDVLSRGVWGESPQSGVTPQRPARSTTVGLGGLAGGQTWREGSAETDGVEVVYVWESVVTEENGATTKTLHEGAVFLDLSGFDDDTEYYQAKYTAGGQTHYWTYSPDAGQHPDLDGVYDPDYSNPGTYFPFALFRHHHENRTADGLEGTEEFQSTEKLLSYIDVDFKTLGDEIHENPDIGDVEQAAMIMAVPANSQDQVELDYLHRFWSRLCDDTPRVDPGTLQTWEELSYGPRPNYAVSVADADFEMVISYVDIKRRRVGGSIGPVGTFTNEVSSTQWHPEILNIPVGEAPVRVYRKQILTSMYEEILVVSPVLRYDIYQGKGTLGAAEDDRLLIPLDYSLCRRMKITDREYLYYRSLHLVFNSRVTETVKWYERNAFKWVLTVAAVVITIISLGSTWQAITAAVANAATTAAAITAIVMILLEVLIQAVLADLVFDVLVDILGPKVAFIAAAVMAVWAGARAMESGGFGKDLWADRLMRASTGLVSSAQEQFDDMLRAIVDEAAEFADMAQTKWEELEEVNDLLDAKNLLDPFAFIGDKPKVIFGEKPQDYFGRTVHAGNPGAMSMDMVENFVGLSLQLPDLHSSL